MLTNSFKTSAPSVKE
jgi:hypothetical protein